MFFGDVFWAGGCFYLTLNLELLNDSYNLDITVSLFSNLREKINDR